MSNIDERLFGQFEALLQTLNTEYAGIDPSHLSEGAAPKSLDAIHLELKTFQAIAQECKEELEGQTLEEMEQTLYTVYHIPKEGDIATLLLEKLRTMNRHYVELEVGREDAKTLFEQYRHDIELIDTVLETIQSRMMQIEHERHWIHLFYKKRLARYEELYRAFHGLHQEMVGRFESMQRLSIGRLVENFHYLYLFLVYTIRVLMMRNREGALIEVAALIEGYKKILKPLRSTGSLRLENLRSSYVLQELNALERQITRRI